MDIWLSFFGVAAVGGLVVFLFLRRDRRRPSDDGHSLDEAPSFNRRDLG